MGVSRNRKNQKLKSRQRSLIDKNKKVKARKELMQLFQNAQNEAEKNLAPSVVGTDEIGDIGDIDLDTVAETQEVPKLEFVTENEIKKATE